MCSQVHCGLLSSGLMDPHEAVAFLKQPGQLPSLMLSTVASLLLPPQMRIVALYFLAGGM